MLRQALLGSAAVGLIGMPYVFSSSGLKESITGLVDSSDGGSQTAAAIAGTESGVPARSRPAATGTVDSWRPAQLGELFRFDITADWVLSHWTSVSTVTSERQLKGYRVALVTGTAEHDLAGSLTYFFNNERRLQRIVFHGSTGNPGPLVQVLTTELAFRPETYEDAGLQLYRVRYGGEVVSELQIVPAAVVSADSSQNRFRLHLLIERPVEHQLFAPGEQRGSSFKL